MSSEHELAIIFLLKEICIIIYSYTLSYTLSLEI